MDRYFWFERGPNMILNTQFILSSIREEKEETKKLNPLQERDQQISLQEQEKERKLQQQVSMIFKDKAYKPFQESALSTQNPVKIETPEEKQKREEREERLMNKKMAHQTAQIVGGAFARSAGYGAANTLIGHGLNLAAKGVTHGVNAVKNWMT